MKRWQIISSSIVIFLITIAALAVIVAHYVDWNKHSHLVADWVGSKIDKEVSIKGDIELELWPEIRFDIEGLHFKNQKSDKVSRVNSVLVYVSPMSFFNGTFIPTRIDINDFELSLEKNNEKDPLSHENLFWLVNSAFHNTALPLINEINLTNGNIYFFDIGESLVTELRISNFSYQAPKVDDNSTIALAGDFNGLPLRLNGSIERFPDDNLKTEIEASLGSLNGYIEGTVKNATKNPNISIEIKLKSSNLKKVVQKYKPDLLRKETNLFDGLFSFEAELLGNPNKDLRLEKIKFSGSSKLAEITANGSIDLMNKKNHSDSNIIPQLYVNISTDSLGKLTNLYSGRVPFEAKATATGVVKRSKNGFTVDEVFIEALGEYANLEAKGNISNILSLSDMEISLNAEARTNQLYEFLKSYDSKKLVKGAAIAQAKIIGVPHKLNVTNIKLKLDSDVGTLNATGGIGPLGKRAYFNVPFEIYSDDFKSLASQFGWESPFSGQIDVAGELNGKGREINISKIDADILNQYGYANIKGSINSPFINPSPNLKLDLAIDDLSTIAKQFNFSLPNELKMRADVTALVESTDNRIFVRHFSGNLFSPFFQTGVFSGQMSDVSKIQTLALGVNLDIKSVERFSRLFDLNLKSNTEAQIRANLVGTIEKDKPFFLTLNMLNEDIILSVNGQISELSRNAQFDLRANLDAKNYKVLGLPLPDVKYNDRVGLKVSLRRNKQLQHPLLKGSIEIYSNNFDAKLDGAFSWPPQIGSHIDAYVKATSLSIFPEIIPNYLNANSGEVTFKGSLSLDETYLSSGKFSLNIGENDIHGSATINGLKLGIAPELSLSKEGKVEIKGSVRSKRLNLIELFPNKLKNLSKSRKKTFLSDDNQWSLEWLKEINLDFALKAEQLITRKFETKNITTDIIIKDGDFKLEADSGEFSGGRFNMNIALDTKNTPVDARFDFSITGLDLDQVPELRDSKLPLQGEIDVDIFLIGEGDSLKKVLGKSSGRVFISASDAYIPASSLDLLTRSISAQIIGIINPQEKSEFHDLECGVIGYRIIDGAAISADSVALQTRKVTYLVRDTRPMQGGFNFRDESIGLAIRTRARELFGVSVADLTNIFRLGGTITNPIREVDPQQLLKTGVTWGVVTALPPLAIIKVIADKWNADQDVCKSAEENYETLISQEIVDIFSSRRIGVFNDRRVQTEVE